MLITMIKSLLICLINFEYKILVVYRIIDSKNNIKEFDINN